jgi:hypothetical protein
LSVEVAAEAFVETRAGQVASSDPKTSVIVPRHFAGMRLNSFYR